MGPAVSHGSSVIGTAMKSGLAAVDQLIVLRPPLSGPEDLPLIRADPPMVAAPLDK